MSGKLRLESGLRSDAGSPGSAGAVREGIGEDDYLAIEAVFYERG